MPMLVRVNYRFPEHSELRYLDHVPMEGSAVRSKGATWYVHGVRRDAAGGYTVTVAATAPIPVALERRHSLAA